MSIRLLRYEGFVLNVRTRFPFRYGIATLTACPHLFLRAEVEVDGQRSRGIAADHLPPKWFTKNPETPYRDDLVDMIGVIHNAGETAKEIAAAANVYRWWQHLNDTQMSWASDRDIPPLLAGFGTSLIERAVIDAFCRARSTSFPKALRENLFGFEGGDLAMLPREPLRQIISRHTVGLSDPISDGDIPAEERVKDGLPQSLEQCIAYYGLTHFKIKLSGDVARDSTRLRDLAKLILNSSPNYAFTLDGNETFTQVEPLRALWESLTADARLRPFLSRLIFLEQPLHRDIAMSDSVRSAMRAWPNRPPMIIDESDASLDSLPLALACGYAGASHKNCKGIFKGITSACRIAAAKIERPDARLMLSGEDLSNIGPVALPQDLAVMATLGIEHVERNSQHYFRGLSHLSEEMQQTAMAAQGDLYRRHERGFVTMNIRNGKIGVGSSVDAPFGVPFDFDPSQFTPLDQWSFDSL